MNNLNSPLSFTILPNNDKDFFSKNKDNLSTNLTKINTILESSIFNSDESNSIKIKESKGTERNFVSINTKKRDCIEKNEIMQNHSIERFGESPTSVAFKFRSAIDDLTHHLFEKTAIPSENEFNSLETNDEDLGSLRKLFSEVPEGELDMPSAGIAVEKMSIDRKFGYLYEFSNHLKIEEKDTASLFELMFEIVENSSPELANFLLGTLDMNVKYLLENQVPIKKFRSAVLKDILNMIKAAKSLDIDLSTIPKLSLLSCKRKNWTILNPQKSQEAQGAEKSTSLLMTLGSLGQGSINKVTLVWDKTRGSFFAMRAADNSSLEKMTKAITKVEEIRRSCLFSDAIVKPGELIALEKMTEFGTEFEYASLEELATHKDLAQQISLFRDNPRELMIQLIEQFIEFQKNGVALADIKPANINVYKINGNYRVKFSDLDGAKTVISIKKNIDQALREFVKFYENNPDRLRKALNHLTGYHKNSFILDSDEEKETYLSFRRVINESIDTYISPGYSTGSEEYTRKILYEATKHVFQRLSEIDTTKDSFEEDTAEIAHSIVDRLQKLDCHAIGASLLEVFVDLTRDEKKLRYEVLKNAFKGESILKHSVTNQAPLLFNSTPPLQESSPQTPKISSNNPYRKANTKPVQYILPDQSEQLAESAIVQISPEDALVRLREKLEKYLINLSNEAKLPPQTADIILDLISGNLSNDEAGLIRLNGFLEDLKGR